MNKFMTNLSAGRAGNGKLSTKKHMKTTSKIGLGLINMLMVAFAVILLMLPSLMRESNDALDGMDKVKVTYTNINVEFLRSYEEQIVTTQNSPRVKSEWRITYNMEYNYKGQHYSDFCEETDTVSGSKNAGYNYHRENGDTDIYAISIIGDKKTLILQSSENDINDVQLITRIMAGAAIVAMIVIDIIAIWVVRNGLGVRRR
ncbi:MAG: hypothetical protein Q4F06_04410 [Eubacteriales bacterium]|nr:hypothetical protein [Eubacteriales bacterium]